MFYIGETVRVKGRLFYVAGKTATGSAILVDDEGNRMIYGRAA